MEEDGKGGWGRVKRVMAGVWEEVERGGGTRDVTWSHTRGDRGLLFGTSLGTCRLECHVARETQRAAATTPRWPPAVSRLAPLPCNGPALPSCLLACLPAGLAVLSAGCLVTLSAAFVSVDFVCLVSSALLVCL